MRFPNLLLQCVSVDHHCNRFVGIKIAFLILAGQAKERVFCFFDPSFPNKPPWTFWGQCNPNKERDRPHPLKTVRNAVRPLICPAQHRFNYPNPNNLTEAPTEVHVGGQITRQNVRSKPRPAQYSTNPRNATGQTSDAYVMVSV